MDFENLEKEFFKVEGDSLAFIRYFESNSDAIAKLDDNDGEQKTFKLKMNGDYGLSLAGSGSTEKAIEILSVFIPKFEQESGLSETELLKAAYYEHLLWAFGSSLYYTDKVDDTEKVFERLVKLQPTNQKYRNWLRATKEKRFSKLRTGLYVSVFAWLFIDILFKNAMDSGLNGIFLMCGAGIVCGTLILEAYLFVLRKR